MNDITAREIMEAVYEATLEACQIAHAKGDIEINNREEAREFANALFRHYLAQDDDFLRAIGTEIWYECNARAKA